MAVILRINPHFESQRVEFVHDRLNVRLSDNRYHPNAKTRSIYVITQKDNIIVHRERFLKGDYKDYQRAMRKCIKWANKGKFAR